MSLLKEISAVVVHELALLFNHRLWCTPWLVVATALLMAGLLHLWVIGARESIYDLLKFEILLLIQLVV